MPQNGATETARLGPAELRRTIDTILRKLRTGPNTAPKNGYEELPLL